MTASIGSAVTWRGTGITAVTLEQWEYEITGAGRVRYVVDDHERIVWLIYASPRHPKDTDR
ncbi:MAG TPA: hypothetical protein VMC83_31195 [Streptosporangiaceae bacterium]|nr:hypothetical protein [Streptosporangiaceae bacterium]